ncbi:MAG: hypothetical protein Q9210_004691 [Variospora velana]
MAATTTEPSFFMRLPPELRIQIYQKLQFYYLLQCSPYLSCQYLPCRCKLRGNWQLGCDCNKPSNCLCRCQPCPERKTIRKATYDLLFVSKKIYRECFDDFIRSFTYTFEVNEGSFFVKTPDITRMMNTNGSDKWTIDSVQVRNMRKWTVLISLGGRPASGFGPRDSQGYLIEEYCKKTRRRRMRVSKSSIANIRYWLRKWSVRLVDAGTELHKLEVRVSGADLITLCEGDLEKELHEMDLLAPLRDLKVKKNGHVSIDIEGEAYSPMEKGSKGFEVKNRNNQYADRIVEAMFREVRETEDARLRRELRCFAKSIGDCTATIGRINRGAGAAKGTAQTQLEYIDSSTTLEANERSLALALEEVGRMKERAMQKGTQKKGIRKRTEKRGRKKMLSKVEEAMKMLRYMEEWFHIRQDFRLWWPGEVQNPFLDWKTAPRIVEKFDPWDTEANSSDVWR